MNAREYPTIALRDVAVKPLRRGHPWAFREGLATRPSLATGTAVRALAPDGSDVAFGVYDAESAIAFRRWSRNEPLSANLLRTRLERAFALRTQTFGDDTNAYRLLHGEADRTPGLVIDRYGTLAVVRTDGAASMNVLSTYREAVVTELAKVGIDTILLRGDIDAPSLPKTGRQAAAAAGTPKVTLLHGTALPTGLVPVREHGVPFLVDILYGQKTGAFLDQRENRRRVGVLAKGRSVLNLFSYAGGFSLHAALGGSRKVTSVDVAPKAHVTAQKSFEAAGVAAREHEFVSADVFSFLDDAARKGRVWDLVICDPPSFAPNQASVPRALAAYRSLHTACVKVLAKAGIFCAASCSSHVHTTDFFSTLDDITLGRDDLRIMESFGPPSDHPTLPAFPEGAYLKFAVLA